MNNVRLQHKKCLWIYFFFERIVQCMEFWSWHSESRSTECMQTLYLFNCLWHMVSETATALHCIANLFVFKREKRTQTCMCSAQPLNFSLKMYLAVSLFSSSIFLNSKAKQKVLGMPFQLSKWNNSIGGKQSSRLVSTNRKTNLLFVMDICRFIFR